MTVPKIEESRKSMISRWTVDGALLQECSMNPFDIQLLYNLLTRDILGLTCNIYLHKQFNPIITGGNAITVHCFTLFSQD